MTQNTRSDESIKKEVQQCLESCPYLDASDIEVVVESGFVDLNGTVRDKLQQKKAEKIIKDIPGVKEVFNYITIDKKNGLIGYANDDVHMI